MVLTFSCSSRNNSEASGTIVTAPAMDINTATFLGNLAVVRQHIAAGSDLNKKDDYGSTPLITATLFGKTDVALALIEGGADLNLRNNDGSTALHNAAFFCRPEILKALLSKGADKELRNNYGSTPYESVAGPWNATTIKRSSVCTANRLHLPLRGLSTARNCRESWSTVTAF